MKIESIAIYTITIVSIVFLGFLLSIRIQYRNSIYPNVTVSSIRLGGLNSSEALSVINQKAAEWGSLPLTFVLGNQIVGIKPDDLGIKIKTEEIIKKAYSYGHEQNIGINLLVFVKTLDFLDPYNVEISSEIDPEKFIRTTNESFSNLEKKKINATLAYSQKKFGLIPSKEGMEIDRSDLLAKLQDRSINLSDEPIELTLLKTVPDINSNDALEAKRRAEKLILSPLILSYNSKTWKIPGETFAKWLSFNIAPDPNNALKKILALDVDKKMAEDYLATISKDINIAPINAELTTKGEKVEIFSLSKDGIELRIDQTIEKISQAIKNNKWSNDSPINLVVVSASPEITTDSIDNLGITSRIAVGTSNFAGSPKNRRFNINLGAEKFNGVLIKPGEEFSFAKTLGPITKEEGYKAELVIKNGETIPELGGGLCQVSTTAFRAAIYAGLPITERQAHAYPVIYYNPQGMDSTIYPPHPDLRFINDTPNNILIQTKIKGNTLTFEFYGTADGRTIKVRGPQIYDKKPDGSMKAVFYRDIYKDEKLVKTDTFRSAYKSPALYPHKNPLE